MNKSNYRYYSQNGEDFLLWEFFDHKESGFYVDVGAFDGIHLSNSYLFERQGWPGICIEPHPKYFQYCKQSRPQATCLNLACVADDGVESTEFYSEELGLLSGLNNREDDVRARYQRRGIKFTGFEKITIPAMTLTAILEKKVPSDTDIDFISIDVEGAELEVLHGLDLSRYRPRVLVAEASLKSSQRAIDNYICALNGYKKARILGENRFFTRNQRDADKLRDIVVDCVIERNLHPLGEKYTLLPFIDGKKVVPEKRFSFSKVKKSIRRIINALLNAISG